MNPSLAFSAVGVTSAVMDIEIGPPGAELYALEDSAQLIAGTVAYQDGLQFDKNGGSGRITVMLAPRNNSGWFWSPDRWDDLNNDARWDLGLNPTIPLALSLDVAAGTSKLDLRELLLEELSLNVAASDLTLFLPGGDYDATIETDAGAATITLPASGQHTIELQVNAGSVTLELPEGMEAQVEVDQALAGFDVNNSALGRIGTSNIWQTSGYDNSPNQITLILSIAVGAVTIR